MARSTLTKEQVRPLLLLFAACLNYCLPVSTLLFACLNYCLPVSTDKRAVFECVLECQKRIMDEMRPGVPWPDLHRLMWRVTLQHLAGPRLGVIEGDIDEMLEAGLGAVFIPCGMGHLIGKNHLFLLSLPPVSLFALN